MMRMQAPTDYVELRAVVETLKKEGRMTPMQEVREITSVLRLLAAIDPREHLRDLAQDEIRASIDRDPTESAERLWLLVEAFQSDVANLEPVACEVN